MAINWKQCSKRLANYTANFASNLAVVGIGIALFKENDKQEALVYALIALIFGAIITSLLGDSSK